MVRSATSHSSSTSKVLVMTSVSCPAGLPAVARSVRNFVALPISDGKMISALGRGPVALLLGPALGLALLALGLLVLGGGLGLLAEPVLDGLVPALGHEHAHLAHLLLVGGLLLSHDRLLPIVCR